jgi:hypothetical protein
MQCRANTILLLSVKTLYQGFQMVCFQTKNPNLGKFWRVFECKMMVYFMVIWNILRSFGIFYGHLAMLWYFGIFSLVLVYCDKKNLATLPFTYERAPGNPPAPVEEGPRVDPVVRAVS